MLNKLSAVAVLAVALAPVAAFADDAVSATFSASFGESRGSTELNVGAGQITTDRPTSISISGAAGLYAGSAGGASAINSTSGAGASAEAGMAPYAFIETFGNDFETTISFLPTDIEDQLNALIGDSINNATEDFCNNLTADISGLTVDTQVLNAVLPGTVGGSITVSCNNPN